MSVRCMMKCVTKTPQNHVEPDGSITAAARIRLAPQYENDPAKRNPLNEMFGKATPSAEVTMYVTNAAAHEQFVEGQFYFVDFHPVE